MKIRFLEFITYEEGRSGGEDLIHQALRKLPIKEYKLLRTPLTPDENAHATFSYGSWTLCHFEIEFDSRVDYMRFLLSYPEEISKLVRREHTWPYRWKEIP